MRGILATANDANLRQVGPLPGGMTDLFVDGIAARGRDIEPLILDSVNRGDEDSTSTATL
jgi:hypothetical protein